jgi:hypothetical protein
MCITRRRSFINFEAKLGNPSLTFFVMKQATGCWRVSSHLLHPRIGFEAQTDKPPPTLFWGPNQETITIILRPKSSNRRPWFWGPNQEPSQWFWGQTTDKPSPPVLRLNRKTCASRLLHVYDADCTRRHPTSRSSGHWVSDLCLIIPDPPHQVSYSCLDPHRYLPCHICHLHIMRQANTFLHTE